MKFEVSGQRYEFDPAIEKLMGDELLLIDEHLPAGWADRWSRYEFGPRDIVVVTYISAKRAGDERPFGEFVKTIAPLTFKPLPDEAAVKPRAKAKTAPPEDAIGPLVRGRKTKPKAEVFIETSPAEEPAAS